MFADPPLHDAHEYFKHAGYSVRVSREFKPGKCPPPLLRRLNKAASRDSLTLIQKNVRTDGTDRETR